MILIGISGRAQVGKTTSAQYLVKKYGFKEFFFSEYVKQVAELGGWNGLKDERGRRYLQHLGDTMREYDKDIMIKEVLTKINLYCRLGVDKNTESKIVVSDVRLITEIEALKSLGASTWFIKRNVDTSNIPAHSTEQLTEDSFKFDYVFDNNGSFDQLYSGIDQAVTENAKKVKTPTEPKVQQELKPNTYLILEGDTKQLQNLTNYLDINKHWSFDVETDGKHFMLASLDGIGFYLPSHEIGYYVNLYGASKEWTKTVIESLRKYFEDEKTGKLGHNIIYDMHIMKNYNVEVKGPLFDTMVASYIINPAEKPLKLKTLVPKYLNIEMRKYDEIDRDNIQDMAIYCMEDARCTYLLYKNRKEILLKNNLWRLFNDIEMPLLKVLFSMERVGFRVDVDKLSTMREVLEKKAEENKNEFCQIMFGVPSDKVLIKVTKTVKKEKKKIEEQFNIDSNDHLGELFYNIKCYPALSKTKGGKPSTDKFALVKLAERGYEGLDLLIKYRQTTTLLKNFIRPILDDHMINGRVYPSYMQHVARTGRLSSSNPNFQNIPVRSIEGKEIRRCFIADEGYKIIDADLSQIEMRVMAHYSKDENLVKAYSQNLDLHDLTGQLVFGVEPGSTTDPKNKNIRTLCKNLNFGLQYGAGAKKFAVMANLQLPEGSKLTEDQAKEYIEKFFKSYPGIRMVQMQYPKQVRQVGYATTILGRRRYLPDIIKKPYTADKVIDKENWLKTSKAEREAVSTLIQGTASDIIKLAMIKAHSKGIILVSQIHDELVAFSKNENVEKDVATLKDCMENCGVTLIVPIVSNIDVSDVWNQAVVEEKIVEENDDEDLTN